MTNVSAIVNGNALHIPLADGVVQCTCTSPPYWGLRDYGISDQIGLERTPAEYVAHIVAVMREVWRVMRDDGTCWLNLGDSYAGSGEGGGGNRKGNEHGQHDTMVGKRGNSELKSKDMVGIPWRVAFALQDDGWYLRSDIIWAKPNPMPESVRDRPTKSHEYIFLLTKRARYYYDAEAISEAQVIGNNGSSFTDERDFLTKPNLGRGPRKNDGLDTGGNGSKIKNHNGNSLNNPNGTRNRRTVWNIATQPYSGAHFATFPEELPRTCILAGSKAGDLILDPFAGSGTTGRVAVNLGRRFIGVELSREYIGLSHERLTTTYGMGL